MRSLLALLSLMLVAGSLAYAQSAEDLVKVDLVSSVKSIEGGKPFDVAVRYRIAPEWHLYWINPGDSGIPPKLKWQLPSGFVAGEPRFPVPKKFKSEGDIWNYGYSEELILLVSITPPTTFSGTASLQLDTSYLVCKEACLPGKANVKTELQAGSGEKNDTESFGLWLARLPVTTVTPTTVAAEQNDGKIDQIHVTFVVTLPRNTKDPEFFPGPSDTVSFKDIKVDDSGEIQFSVVPLNKISKLDETVMGILAYTDASNIRRGLELKTHLNVDAGK